MHQRDPGQDVALPRGAARRRGHVAAVQHGLFYCSICSLITRHSDMTGDPAELDFHVFASNAGNVLMDVAREILSGARGI
jgi:hypothetical protein